jgi:hypothetical protein
MMKRKSYTEEQRISILKEYEASISAPDGPSAGFFLCPKGISSSILRLNSQHIATVRFWPKQTFRD